MKKRYVLYAVVIGLTFSLFGAQEDYSIILKKNIFTETPPQPPPVSEKTPIIKPAPIPSLTSLIDLIGIVYFGESGSYIVLTVKGKNEELVFQEGAVVENARIVKIEADGVIFFYNEQEERFSFRPDNKNESMISVAPGLSVKLDETNKVEKDKDINGEQIINPTIEGSVPEFTDPVVVDMDTALNEIKNDRELFSKINIAPKVQNGKIDGFQVTNLPLNSLPYKYGLRDGDVVRRVNGIFIDSISKGFSVYNQVINEKTEIVTVEVVRNNSPLVLTFKLK